MQEKGNYICMGTTEISESELFYIHFSNASFLNCVKMYKECWDNYCP